MNSESKKLYFGLNRSKQDKTEHILSFGCDHIDFPIKFSLKDRVKQVYDQLCLNSCSANAAANFISLSDKNDKLKCNISRLFLYFCTRWLDNQQMLPVQDQGATLRSVFDALSKYNYIDEVKYPYIVENVNDVPPMEIFYEAISINRCPISSFRQIVQSKCSIRYALYKLQSPILFGMLVYSNFLQLTKENDILGLPSDSDELLGGHAIVCVGFDEETQTFEILNSHGSSWCNNGYFRLPYRYMLDPNLCFEMYVCQC